MQQLIPATHASEAVQFSPGDALRAISIEQEPEETQEWVLEHGGYSVRLADSSRQRSRASR